LNLFRAELHVHTLLSPCAEIEMIPPLIVQEALDRGIDLIAITDHNSSQNVAAVQKAAAGTGLAVLAGMELQTREEVHSLCLFDTLEQALAFEQWVKRGLPEIANRPDFFGEQFVVDETGDFIRREDQLLLVSTSYSIDEAYRQVEDLEGLFIPAHVNRTMFGLIPVLGIVPTSIPLEALEISRHLNPSEARRKYPQLGSYPLVQNGDAHRLDEFLGVNQFNIETRSISEMRLALQNTRGRSHQLLPC
jgi:3',5'-nucleoside bisphosphate phosphatase